MCDIGGSKRESTVLGTYRRTTEKQLHFGLIIKIVDQTVAQDEAARHWVRCGTASKPPPAK
jgi:hypothetical protein